MDFCPRFPLSAWTHIDRKNALFTRLRCGLWSCEWCAAKNQSIWRAFLLTKLPVVSEEWWLLTLTAHAHKRSAAMSLANIRDNLDRLLKRIRRVFGQVDYVRVYEKHPTSAARHAHLIICGLTDYVVPGCSSKLQPTALAVTERNGRGGVWAIKSWLKKVAQECGMGYMVDCQKIAGNPAIAIGYVCKYLTKSQQDLNEKGLRHVQTSRRVGSPRVAALYSWKVGSFVTARDFNAGQVVTDLQTGTAIDDDYWNEQDYYPPEMI